MAGLALISLASASSVARLLGDSSALGVPSTIRKETGRRTTSCPSS